MTVTSAKRPLRPGALIVPQTTHERIPAVLHVGSRHARLPTETRDSHLFRGGFDCDGVKDSGFNAFLAWYYNRVLGLPPLSIGSACLIALAVDAVTDPFLGHVSDNWRSRLGRRHPFMYAAIVPVAITCLFLWHPPADLQQIQLFLYLLVTAVSVRLFITLFEVPISGRCADE